MATEERNLILIQALSTFASALASIFVSVFFFQHGTFQTTMLYGLCSMGSLFIWYVASGWTLKHVSSGFLMRMGIFASALFYFLLFLLKEQSIHYVIPLGFLQGFFGGNYWAGYNLNQYVFTNKENRAKYFGTMTSILNMLQGTAPFIGGAIVSITKPYALGNINLGYPALFFIVSLILGATAFTVGKLPSHEAPQFSYAHIFSHKRSKHWWNLLLQQILLGLYDTSFTTIIGILFYIVIKQEISLGIVQTGTYILGAIGSFISIKLLQKNVRFYWIGVIGIIVGMLSFAFFQNITGILLYMIITGSTMQFLNNQLSINVLSAFDAVQGSWKEKYHLLIERDAVICLARMTSFIFLYFFLSQGNQVAQAKLWLWVIPVFVLLLGVTMQKNKHT